MLETQSDQLTLKSIEFDTAHFGFSCATCIVPPEAHPSKDSIVELCQQAQASGIKFLTLSSPRLIEGCESQFRGLLYEYEAAFETVLAKASAFPGRFQLEPINASNWSDVLLLARHRSANRFSRDEKFSESSVFQHKVRLYQLQLERFPELAYIAYSAAHEPLGFHICLSEGQAFVQYDLVVRPDYRTGAVALELVAACLRAASKDPPALVKTKIYCDNDPSDKLFTKLGLKRNGNEQHYYHFWL